MSYTLCFRYNLILIDRNYEQLVVTSNEQSTGSLHFEDITVDAATCIVLEEITRLSDKLRAHSLLVKVAALSVKFENCWVVLYLHDAKLSDANRYS